MVRKVSPPQFDEGYDQAEDIPLEQIERIVAWVRDRSELQCAALDTEIAKDVLQGFNGGSVPRGSKYSDAYIAIFEAASRFGFHLARRTRWQQTKDTFPHVQFSIMDGRNACRSAHAHARKSTIFHVDIAPVLPLEKCNRIDCMCDLRLLTQR